MLRLSIPAKLNPLSRPSTPTPIRTPTPRAEQQLRAGVPPLLLRVAIIQVCFAVAFCGVSGAVLTVA
jgi:hypothetical protein